MKPEPSAPSRFSLGTWTLSKNSSAVSWALSPILSRLRPRSKPVHAALDDQQADALVAGVGVGARDHDHEVGQDAVADERLRAVEDVVVALVDRAGPDALEVRAGARLGHRDRRDQLAADQAGQPALLLLVVRQRADVGDDHVVVHREAEPAGAGAGDLLGEHHVVAEVLDPGAAVLLVDVEAEQPGLAGLEPDLAVDLAVLLPLLVVGDDLLLQEGAGGGAEVLVLLLVDRGLVRQRCAPSVSVLRLSSSSIEAGPIRLSS